MDVVVVIGTIVVVVTVLGLGDAVFVNVVSLESI